MGGRRPTTDDCFSNLKGAESAEVRKEFIVCVSRRRRSSVVVKLDRSPAGEHVVDDDDDGDYQKQVEEPAGLAGSPAEQQADQPYHDQYHGYCPENIYHTTHFVVPSF
jgi:hypothetical protein